MSVELLERAAAALGPLVDEVVFVGGATVGVWITDPAAPETRPTLDVDVVVEVTSRGRFAEFEGRLRERRFFEDQDSGILCRWRHPQPSVVLDVMPSDPAILGFASRWYAEVMRDPWAYVLPSGATIAVVSPALLVATKLEAFRDRGRSDYYGSRDFGDVIAVLDGRPEIEADLAEAPDDVRTFVVAEMRRHLEAPAFLDGVYGALRGDAASQARASAVVVPLVKRLVASLG